jgi:hypothetical protein
MEKEIYDPYFRHLPSILVPLRTPFTRPGRHDAEHLFIYMTNQWKRWSLLLDKTCKERIYEEVRQYIPRGIFQLWLVEKRYSTQTSRGHSMGNRRQRPVRLEQGDARSELDQQGEASRPLVVLREPMPDHTLQGDVLSYHLKETDAIAAAESYTRNHHRRAIVGMVLWDEMWLWQ